MDGAEATDLNSAVRNAMLKHAHVGGRVAAGKAFCESRGGRGDGADLGGSSTYSIGIIED